MAVTHSRYSKAKASASNDKGQQQLGLSQGNFGPKYEQHVAQLQQELEELRKKIQVMQRQEAEIRWGRRRAGGLCSIMWQGTASGGQSAKRWDPECCSRARRSLKAGGKQFKWRKSPRESACCHCTRCRATYRSKVPTCQKPQRTEYRKRKAVTHGAKLGLSAYLCHKTCQQR